MRHFIAAFNDQIRGVVSGFDRLVFRGCLRRLMHPDGMRMYLIQNSILCKHYQDHVKKISQDVKEASLAPFRQAGLPVQHIQDPKADKDAIARAIAAERNITSGNVCALTSMELTPTFAHQHTSMAVRWRPTLVIYHYQIDPQFGWMHARIQTWFPFYIHLCINGREWLARRMDQQGLRYLRQDNCFPWIEDIPRAQQLLDEQVQSNWESRLQPFAQRLNPLHDQIFQKFQAQYYWTVLQCEWASDVMFEAGTLRRLEPLFLRHGMMNLSSADVMRFWGKQVTLKGTLPDRFAQDITTSLKARISGERLKHWVQGNSLKAYGKAHTAVGDIFRVETMTAAVHMFCHFRAAEGGSPDSRKWRIMRRGVADLFARTQRSQKANDRYLDSFATVDDSTRIAELLEPLERPCEYNGRRVRALRPFETEEQRLLQAVNRGEYAVNGFRNRDIKALLFAPSDHPLDAKEKRRRSAAISRRLRILRAHGLIRKIPKTHRYQLTDQGRLAINAILTVQQTSMRTLNQAA